MRGTRNGRSPEGESMSEWSYVYSAYALTWASFVVYAWYVRNRRVRAERTAASSSKDRGQA